MGCACAKPQALPAGETHGPDIEDEPRPTPSLIHVLPPRNISLVKPEHNIAVRINVGELARSLALRHKVPVYKAMEALRWCNYDPDDTSALLYQVDEIEVYQESSGGEPGCKRRRLFEMLSASRASKPAIVMAEFARLVAMTKNGMLSQRTKNIKSTTTPPSRGSISQRSYLPEIAVNHDRHLRDGKRSEYFANKCRIKSAFSESPSPASVNSIHLHASQAKLEDVVLESSVISNYLIPPWSPEDPDIMNNFWIDQAPPSAAGNQSFSIGMPSNFSYCNEGSEANSNSASFVKGQKMTSSPKMFRTSVAYETAINTVGDARRAVRMFSNPPGGEAKESGWEMLGDGKWADPEGTIALSDKQIRKIHEWKRITELRVPVPTSKDGQGRVEATFTGIQGPGNTILRPDDPLHPEIILDKPKPNAIRQGFVGDCSFLSSLASLADYECRRKSPVISRLIYPQIQTEEADGKMKVKPLINPNGTAAIFNKLVAGMYACKLHINGSMRKVLVDDFVPVRKDGKLLSAKSAFHREMWVTILEKAFVKLMGGAYFMHGSNPATDLYHLTGWVPDTIPFLTEVVSGAPQFRSATASGSRASVQGSRDPRWNVVWDHLYHGFTNGNCVACLGTSEVLDSAPSGLDFPEGVSISSGIVARHAYSILDCRRVGPLKLLYVRNPWACVRWKGRFAPGDTPNWSRDLEQELGYDHKAAAATDNGAFWIEWTDVLIWFSHLYLCWNNDFFCCEATLHSRWGRSPWFHESILIDDSHCFVFNPQFHIKVAPRILKSGESLRNEDVVDVWILLSRHIMDRKSDLVHKYMAVHIFKGENRVACPPPPFAQGIYCNSECDLVRIRIKRPQVYESALKPNIASYWQAFQAIAEEATKLTRSQDLLSTWSPPVIDNGDVVLVVAQFSRKTPFNLTMKVLSTAPIIVTEIPHWFPDDLWTTLTIRGRWTANNAAGNSNNQLEYLKNPHFRLWVPIECQAKVFVECTSELAVNLRVFPHSCSSVRRLKLKGTMSSGHYRCACCVLETTFAVGVYTLVVSSFKPGDIGNFQLRCHLSIKPKMAERFKHRILQAPLFSFLAPTLGTVTSELINQKVLSETADGKTATQFLALYDLPTPHSWPPSPLFRTEGVRNSGSKLKSVFRLFFRNDADFASVALRLEIDSISTTSRIPKMLVIFGLDPHQHPLYSMELCPTAEMAGMIAYEPFMPLPQPVTGIVKLSDLDGGLSNDGLTPSSIAHQLYKSQRTICVSHVEIFSESVARGVYYVVVDINSEVGEPEISGSFKLYSISDQEIGIEEINDKVLA